ncbi:MAG TPA: beta-propeller fold lactonase family protein [Gemmatimonadales bacterium]|nr:beta-propeller fold lactonase family protein [Gemmatimonadales bacterium]
MTTLVLAAFALTHCAASSPEEPAPMQAARLYVANQDDATVSIIDPERGAVIETVDLRRYGFGDNAKPHHVQVEPDGSAWYVTLIGAGKVLKLDRANRILASADLQVPGLLTLHPTQDLMFVGRSMSAVNPPPRIAVIRRSNMRLLEEIDLLFPRPHGIVAHPDGDRVFAASLGTNQLASVRVADGEVRLVDVPGPAHGFVQAAVSPDGRWLALTAELTDELMVFDLSNPEEPKLSRTVPMPDGPFEPLFTGDGRWLYVTCLGGNRVAVVDTRSWEDPVVLEHEAFAQPHGIALSRDGQHVFVGSRHQLGGTHDHQGGKPSGAGTVVAICAASHTPGAVIEVGNYAAGMGTPLPQTVPPPRPCR